MENYYIESLKRVFSNNYFNNNYKEYKTILTNTINDEEEN